METEKRVGDPVISYMKQFVNTHLRILQLCYTSIRDASSSRYFKKTIRVVEDSDFDAMFPLINGVVLTANKIECDSLNYIVSKQKENCLIKRRRKLRIFPNNAESSPDAYIFKLHCAYVLHLNACETGSNTPGGSTDLVRYISANPFLSPASIISFGVCYGRDVETQQIGDVIIPQRLYPWSIGQKIYDEKVEIKSDKFNLSLEERFSESGVYSQIKEFCNEEDGAILSDTLELGDKDNNCEYNFTVRVFSGNVSTGEAVISSAKAKDIIQGANGIKKELGGEMEGYGLAKECIFYANIPCVIVKAICDWGEYKNIEKEFQKRHIKGLPELKDHIQAYAAFCAGIALIKLYECGRSELLFSDFLRSMSNRKGDNRVDQYNYKPKDIVLKNIKKYYRIQDDERAREIFDTLLTHEIICENHDNSQLYHVNSVI